MRILIADDDLISRRVLEANLKNWGYDVVTAYDGEEALQILRSAHSPRLAILDSMMPHIDGLEVCRTVRKLAGEPPAYILLLTTKGRKEDILQGMDAGADDCLAKPLDAQELKTRVDAGRRIIELREELARAHDTLRYHATHDTLTGLWNRAAIVDLLQRELGRASREGLVFAAAMADLDQLKGVNDAHGHAVGDQVLREAARRMSSVLRGYDAIGRYGAEEFLIILPGCGVTGAPRLAERLRAAVGSHPMEVGSSKIRVTVSLGVAVANARELSDIPLFIRAAEAALHLAKNRGRNRVELAFSTQPPTEFSPAESA